LICYTDGLIEAQNATAISSATSESVTPSSAARNRNVEEICEMLIGEVSRFVGSAELEDDQTLVVARHAAGAQPTGTPDSGASSGAA
jgi:serine phosphatase RsbU (regulator of sigma subunit)